MKVTYIEGSKVVQEEILDFEGLPLDPPEYQDVTVGGNGTGPTTGFNRGPTEGESTIEINPAVDMERGYGYEVKYYDVVDFKLTLKSLEEIEGGAITERKLLMQAGYKGECIVCILAKYPEPIQRSAAIGVYPELVEPMAIFIAACIAEENRLYDAVENALSMEELDNIVSNFEDIV